MKKFQKRNLWKMDFMVSLQLRNFCDTVAALLLKSYQTTTVGNRSILVVQTFQLIQLGCYSCHNDIDNNPLDKTQKTIRRNLFFIHVVYWRSMCIPEVYPILASIFINKHYHSSALIRDSLGNYRNLPISQYLSSSLSFQSRQPSLETT